MLRILLLLPVLAGLASCMGMRGPAMGSGGPPGSAALPPDESPAYTTMFVGPGKLQRFIRPVSYTGPGDERFELDITYRDTANVPNRAELRGSLLGATRTAPDTLAIAGLAGGQSRYPVSKMLYQEGKGRQTLTRIEVVLDPARLGEFLRDPASPILLHRPGAGYTTFVPDKKTKKRLAQAARLVAPLSPVPAGG